MVAGGKGNSMFTLKFLWNPEGKVRNWRPMVYDTQEAAQRAKFAYDRLGWGTELLHTITRTLVRSVRPQ